MTDSEDWRDPANWADSVFISDYPVPTPVLETTNKVIPDTAGGLIEAVKKTVVNGLKEALAGSAIDLPEQREIHVDMEYPIEEQQYPGIWVQYSTRTLQSAGLGNGQWVQKEDQSWVYVEEWLFTGTVTLTVVALSSLVRDRISDFLTANFAFSRAPTRILTDPKLDIKEYRSFITALVESPYASVMVNSDQLQAGGQNATMGVPWSEDVRIPAYEDNYSFDLMGAFQHIFEHDGNYILREIKTNAEMEEQSNAVMRSV